MSAESDLADALTDLKTKVWAVLEPPLNRLAGWLNRLLAKRGGSE